MLKWQFGVILGVEKAGKRKRARFMVYVVGSYYDVIHLETIAYVAGCFKRRLVYFILN